MNTLDLHQQFIDQRRGRYVRVSDTDRRQLIDAYKKGEDFIALAKKLNIKRSTGKRVRQAINNKTNHHWSLCRQTCLLDQITKGGGENRLDTHELFQRNTQAQ